MRRHFPARTPEHRQSAGRSELDYSERARGIVQAVDLVGRDLMVRLERGVEVFDIPPDCPILLHGENVKLRLVQPCDHVWLTYRRTPDRLIALKLEVQPDSDS